MIKYWAMMLVMLFGLFWTIVSVTTSIDLTLIGHLRGWKKYRYARWLVGFIDKNRKGYNILADCTTHPQVLVMLFFCFIILCGSIFVTVCVWRVINSIKTIVVCIVDAFLYIPAITWLLFSKIKVKREYRQHYQ